jgi:hypothetical protein
MEQCQMRTKLIALRRKMSAALTIKPRKISITKQRRNDNWSSDLQIST